MKLKYRRGTKTAATAYRKLNDKLLIAEKVIQCGTMDARYDKLINKTTRGNVEGLIKRLEAERHLIREKY